MHMPNKFFDKSKPFQIFTILLFTIYYLLRFDKEGLLVNPFLYSLFVQMI